MVWKNLITWGRGINVGSPIDLVRGAAFGGIIAYEYEIH